MAILAPDEIKNPGGHCGVGGTGVRCPVGPGVQAAE
jgi:hypothetical protein